MAIAGTRSDAPVRVSLLMDFEGHNTSYDLHPAVTIVKRQQFPLTSGLSRRWIWGSQANKKSKHPWQNRKAAAPDFLLVQTALNMEGRAWLWHRTTEKLLVSGNGSWSEVGSFQTTVPGLLCPLLNLYPLAESKGVFLQLRKVFEIKYDAFDS